MHLFDFTNPPPPDILHKRGDPNDIRLGEIILTNHRNYAQADIVLLGLPQDEGVQRNGGRIGAKDAPDAIRTCLYKYVAIDSLKLFDLGNTTIGETLEVTHQIHREIVRQVLRDGKSIIVIGGGNDTSYPDCSALALETQGSILVFNIDAHYDVRADTIPNSGTPYRQLLKEGHIQPQHFYEIGSQPFANSSIYANYLQERGVTIHDHDSVQQVGIEMLIQQILDEQDADAIFWGLDMDVVRSADAPGVSAPNPTGLTGTAFSKLGRIAGIDRRTRIFEITEVNPRYDIDQRTSRLAAATIWHYLQASRMHT